MVPTKPVAKTKLNLYQKLVEVRKSVEYLQKDTKGYNFNYVAGSKVLGSLRKQMDDQGLLLVSAITDSKYEVVEGNKKNYVVSCNMMFTWINAENPEEKLEVPYCAFGSQSDVSQALGSALTYSERYFMLKFFNIATDKDDPDAHTAKQEPVKKLEPDAVDADVALICDAFKQATCLLELEAMRATYKDKVNAMPKDSIAWIKMGFKTMQDKLTKEDK